MKSLLKKILLGTNVSQEYLCLALNEFQDPLEIIFRSDELEFDVTGNNLFFGYKFVLIGIIFNKGMDTNNIKNAELCFTEKRTGKTIAIMKLQLNNIHETLNNRLAVYKCIYGSHGYQNILNKLFVKIQQGIQKKKTDNVDLPGNIYEQVKIAYSVPRKISLITLGENGLNNLFPTDLHGKIDDENYVISLRTTGKANEQVNKYKKIIVCTMNLNRYRYVYSLGKNHMREPRSLDKFEFSENTSEKFNLPIPVGCIDYLELEHINSETAGIHNLNYFRIINSIPYNINHEPILSHIHRDYIAWLLKKGYKINYLLR